MKIGADPEFVFINTNGDFVPAHNLLSGGDFGLDGHSETGELRPIPATDSVALVANIAQLIRDGYATGGLHYHEMLAGHYKKAKAIGGHIHISGISPNEELFKCLKKSHQRLSDCIDNLTERERRQCSGYGLGDSYQWKVADHGGIEFRVPGSWLLSPQVAFMNLWLAEATAYAYVVGQSDILNVFDEFYGCQSIEIFAKRCLGKVPNADIFLKVISKIFPRLPINWDEPINKYWL